MVLQGPLAKQLGMALGFLFVLPLGDGRERRRLLAPSFGVLLLSWFALGLMALIPSLLPPFLTALTPEASRGRMLGIVLSGQFSGILLSRSVSGVLAQLWGWGAIYAVSALAMLAIALLFRLQVACDALAPAPDQAAGGVLQALRLMAHDATAAAPLLEVLRQVMASIALLHAETPALVERLGFDEQLVRLLVMMAWPEWFAPRARAA